MLNKLESTVKAEVEKYKMMDDPGTVFFSWFIVITMTVLFMLLCFGVDESRMEAMETVSKRTADENRIIRLEYESLQRMHNTLLLQCGS